MRCGVYIAIRPFPLCHFKEACLDVVERISSASDASCRRTSKTLALRTLTSSVRLFGTIVASARTPLSACNASVGKLLCEERPVHGGSGNPTQNNTRFDEPGYIAIPDCFWGDAAFGLEAPLNLTGVPLHMVKTCNATFEHYGEMAGGQPWVLSAS